MLPRICSCLNFVTEPKKVLIIRIIQTFRKRQSFFLINVVFDRQLADDSSFIWQHKSRKESPFKNIAEFLSERDSLFLINVVFDRQLADDSTFIWQHKSRRESPFNNITEIL